MLTLLVNGYSESEAEEVKKCLNETFLQTVLLATHSQSKKISHIIEEEEKNFYPQGTQICMFVEFEEEDINRVLRLFPKSLKRPLFCALTESNSEWNLAYLGSHLIEERREMMEKMKEVQKN